mgnify:CR=1 FL=1
MSQLLMQKFCKRRYQSCKGRVGKNSSDESCFDHNYASRLDGNNVKDCKNRWDMVEQLREDIRNF